MKLLIYLIIFISLAGCTALNNSRRQYISQHPGTEYKKEILNGYIKKGMTKAEVRASWGDPCTYCYGTRQTSEGDWWEYNIFGSSSSGAGSGTYLFFNNAGILEYWSN